MPLTPQERAEKIRSILSMAEHYNEGYGGGTKEMWDQTMQEVAAQISEAEEAAELRAYRSSEETWKKRFSEAEREAVENEKKHVYVSSADGYVVAEKLTQAYTEGFNAAKEKARSLFPCEWSANYGNVCSCNGCVTADRIAAMQPADSSIGQMSPDANKDCYKCQSGWCEAHGKDDAKMELDVTTERSTEK